MVLQPPTGTASFDVFCVNIGARFSAVAFLKNPSPKKMAVSLSAERREITHAQKRNRYTDLDEISNLGRYHRHSHLHKFLLPSVEGFLGGGVSNFTLSQ